MDGIDVVEYPDDVTDEELDMDAWTGALQNAEHFGIYPDSDRELYEEDDIDIDEDKYSSNIEGYWEDYDAKKHDMLKPGGGKWFD
jgi:hypothetical protein